MFKNNKKSNLDKIYDILLDMTDEERQKAVPLKYEYVAMDWGEQLKFTIPTEDVGMIEEIRDEIMEFLNSNRDVLVDNRFISKVEKIFDKYLKLGL